MTVLSLPASQSASVRSAAADQTDPGAQTLRLSSAHRSFVDVEMPAPYELEASIVSAALKLYKAGAWSAGDTITVQAIDADWDSDTVTWNLSPAVRTPTATLVVATAGAYGDALSVDVTAILQDTVGSARAWYGLRVVIAGAGEQTVVSAFGDPSYRPTLDVEFNVRPEPPDDLRPDGDRRVSKTKPLLEATFTDFDGEDAMAYIEVEIDNADDFDTTAGLTYDSGQIAHSAPYFDLTTPPTGAPATPTLSTATQYFWRMRVWDNHGAVSDWSDIASFYVATAGTLTITAPSAGALAVPTPAITHTFTGATQEQVEVIVEHLIGGVYVEHYHVPQYVSTATSHTVPDAYALQPGETYRITVRVWDNVDRDDMAGDRAFKEASVEVTLDAVLV
jgi:hypothetical protein